MAKGWKGGQTAPTGSGPAATLPHAFLLDRHRPWRRGARAQWNAAPTATAPGGGWDRLEPVRTGGTRPRAYDSQREPAAHDQHIPARGGRGVGDAGAVAFVSRPSPPLPQRPQAAPARKHTPPPPGWPEGPGGPAAQPARPLLSIFSPRPL